MPHSLLPRKSASGAEDAQRAEESQQQNFADSVDSGLEAAWWAIREAQQATRTAGQQLIAGNPTGSLNALHRADRAIGAARDSLQGVIQ